MPNKKTESEPVPETCLLSLSQATGYFEIDDFWPLWQFALDQGEAEALLRHAHTLADQYIFKDSVKHDSPDNTKRWHIASILARLLSAHRVRGHDSRYPHPYKDAQHARGGFRLPKGYRPPERDFTIFPFVEGKGRKKSDNPNEGEVLLENPYG